MRNVLIVTVLAVLTACASSEVRVDYVPPSETYALMSQTRTDFLNKTPCVKTLGSRSSMGVNLKRYSFGINHVSLITQKDDAKEYLYETLGDTRLLGSEFSVVGLGIPVFGLELSADDVLWISRGSKEGTMTSLNDCRQVAMTLADVLFTHRLAALIRAEDAAFASMIPKRLSLPKYTEEARRYGIQAESAIRQKRLADAANLYGQALKASPFWTDARYNRALVLAELKRYREAMAEMRRYIQLEPNSTDRRALQDKIYEWEGLLRASN